MKTTLSWTRIISLTKKEVHHILRDPFTMGMAIGLPVFMVFFFGYAINFNIQNIPMTVYNQSHSTFSRELIESFNSSHFFKTQRGHQLHDLSRDVQTETSRATLIIPPRFERDIRTGRTASVQILLDGSDNSTVGIIGGYLQGVQALALRKILNIKEKNPVALKTRYLFNPELNSHWFTIPGLSVTVIAMIAIFMTSLTIAREWENGSMELLLSTPVHPFEIIIGKLLPYVALGLLGELLIYIVARVGFNVPFTGSYLIFLVSSLMFLSAYMSLGIFISVATRQQMLAMQFSMMIGMLPTMLLSGFIFPIESMPTFFHYFTGILPARWFMVIARGLFLKNQSLMELIKPLGFLAVLDFLLILLATRKFKKDLEP
jgi:ABC-2 type transport system permease protein